MLKGRTVAGYLRIAWLAQAGLLLLASPAAAQVKMGDFSTKLNGIITTGFTADYGNLTSSDHSWTVGGDANLSGSFYNPNFISFAAGVYLNQSRANSDFQSISNTSGVNANATIFGGSRFPGAIGYSKAYDSEGSYAVPGVANYVTHGNSDTLGINWSENLPNVPSFSAGFQLGSSEYSIYGSNDKGENSFHSLNLHSSYRLEGFTMGAYFDTGGGHSLIPEVISGQQDTESTSGDTTYGFNVSHRLPLHGSVSANINRSSWNTDYQGSNSTGGVDMVNVLALVQPTSKLALSASANYSDNLSGQLDQSVLATGGVVTGINSNDSSYSLDLVAAATYAVERNLGTSAYVEHRIQFYLGQDYDQTSYGGGANYERKLFSGIFNSSLTVVGNTSEQAGANSLGFSTNENYSTEFLGWKVTGLFGYAQDVQTLLVTDMNSYYNYSGSARRRWGRFNFSASAGAARTALTQQPGTANSSESYGVSMGFSPVLTASGGYSKSNGQALETGTGLVPVTGPIPPSSLVSLYGGDGYSLALSSAPIRGLILTASYAKSNSNISTGGVASANDYDQYNALIQYQARKLNLISGYSRLGQGFSGSGSPPEVISSYYVGVSRWFNFF